MSKNHLQNLFKNRYFIVFALLLMCMGIQVSYYGIQTGPDNSLQLSSEATDDSPESSEKYYDVQLRLIKNQFVTVGNKRVKLERGAIIGVSVPESALNETKDPSKVDLLNVAEVLRKKSQSPFIRKSEFTIVESKNKNLIGESTILKLKDLAIKKVIKVDSIEKEEDDSDDISVSDSEGSVCTSCLKVDKIENNKTAEGLFGLYHKLIDSKISKITSMDDVVKNYENSPESKKLIETVDKGYSVRFHGRVSRVKNGIESRSRRACYRGVKIALQKSGLTNGDYLKGISAKQAGKFLEQYGFINLLDTDYKDKIKSPYDCPKGSVIVYSGGRHGHIEVCTGSGFISDYYSSEPRTGNRMSANGRTVIGIYIKSNNEINNYLVSNDYKKDGQDENKN